MQPGDILFARIEQHDGTFKFRPCLVMHIAQAMGQAPVLTVAYGTSKRTSVRETQPWELAVRPEDGRSVWAACGLACATVFCFSKRFTLSSDQVLHARLVGALHISLAPRVDAVIADAKKRQWR